MRIEHFNDPKAPKPNSIVVAVTAFVVDDDDRVLLIRRTHNSLWALPGGAQEFGEYIAETVARETREEAGIEVEATGHCRGVHQPQPLRGAQRRRGAPVVLALLPGALHQRRTDPEQRILGCPVGPTRGPGRAAHPPLDETAY